MKRQTRPFIVEVKHKRGTQISRGSIWGDLDLSAIAAQTTGDVRQNDLTNGQLVDSGVMVLDVDARQKRRVKQIMVDPQEAETIQIATEAAVETPSSEQRNKVARPRKANAEAKRPTGKNSSRQSAKAIDVSAAAVRATRKTYSEKERAQKLAQIEKAIAGGARIKNAVGQAEISEQTYYQWKKAAIPVADVGDLKDLLALEEENKRLKSLLAERLRKENAELKKKLGLA